MQYGLVRQLGHARGVWFIATSMGREALADARLLIRRFAMGAGRTITIGSFAGHSAAVCCHRCRLRVKHNRNGRGVILRDGFCS